MKKITHFIQTHYEKLTIVGVVVFLIVLRFLPISYADLLGDGAINSFRAFGWYDWLSKTGQTTPIEWFGYIPGWATMSFHDAPPIAFLIQNIFFSLFGGGAVVARLPFVLGGVGAIFLTWYLLKKISGPVVAALAALLYSVISYSIWAENSAYLEGMEELFIVGSMLIGGYFLFKSPTKKSLYFWAICTVLALMTKYTAMFLLPPLGIYGFLYRDVLKENIKHVIFSVLICLTLLSPVIIYNVKMYQARGHFDAALSSIVGMHPEDFSIISKRGPSLNLVSNFKSAIYILADNVSYPLLALFMICAIFLLWHVVRKIRTQGLKTFESWMVVNLGFLFLMFAFAPPANRFLSIFTPFIAIMVALVVALIFQKLNNYRRYAFGTLVALIFIFELVYSINTNLLKDPKGPVGWLYSANKLQNIGFNQLDDFIRTATIPKLPHKNAIRTKADTAFSNEDVEGRSVVIFDDRINWFAQMWYMQRYFLYYRWPVISTSFLTQDGPNKIDINDLLRVSGKPLYFVYPIDPRVIDEIRSGDPVINAVGPDLIRQFEKAGVPSDIIYNAQGAPAFKVYTIENHE